MQKLMRNDSSYIRILEESGSSCLIIDCMKRSMPFWVEYSYLSDFKECAESDLWNASSFSYKSEASNEDKRIAQLRYSQIACILPFIGDKVKRSKMIELAATKIGKQTIRKYLCLYLAFQDIAILYPEISKDSLRDDCFSSDERNMRWALNKFFYSSEKNSLQSSYTMMLKEKYCSPAGDLLSPHPSFYQFRYFYRKHKQLQHFYISRNGIKNYQRNSRPLLGNGVQEFAPAVGVGMLDATICDIYLINEKGSLVGRPILTACVDAFSGLCCGYSLTWEGGVYSLRSLMLNVIKDKIQHCNSFGISITEDQWPSHNMPGKLVTDMGSEYKSYNFEQISELGVTLINLPPYRPELKGPVEKFFDVIQKLFKKHLKGKGILEPDFQERGAHDYRKDACLTMDQFEKILLYCIIYYNSQRLVPNFPFSEKMLSDNIVPCSSNIYQWSASLPGANLLDIAEADLILTLLPRASGHFTRKGLIANGLRYKNLSYTEKYLSGGNAVIAFNPDDVSYIWVIENGKYVKLTLIEDQFNGKSISYISDIRKKQKEIIANHTEENLQAQIDLATHIEIVANHQAPKNIGLHEIRTTRKTERQKQHKDFMKEGYTNE